MEFRCMECGAAPCFLENEAIEKDPSPFADAQPYYCPYNKNSIEAKWELIDRKEQNKNPLCVCGIDSMPMNEYGKMICNCCHKPIYG